ncbi:tetratricopeptide-like helical domain-containing protein [Artemisia annua]|uniref:Tetratricopeptide-like helical domain-containing protein n=1 Tax=Artemisia annua TaxID=35608 RepID=A0A2U1LMS9_ARTAN|nr:tetratricopeptide-like helical domain-containing protein [Artemisia annua]
MCVLNLRNIKFSAETNNGISKKNHQRLYEFECSTSLSVRGRKRFGKVYRRSKNEELLPKDVLVSVFARVASSSFQDLFNAKLSCTDFLEAANDEYIYKYVSMDKFPVFSWNPPSDQKEYFKHGNVKSGLEFFKRASEKKHLEATYVYRLLLLSRGGESSKQGLELLNGLKSSRPGNWNVRESRDKCDLMDIWERKIWEREKFRWESEWRRLEDARRGRGLIASLKLLLFSCKQAYYNDKEGLYSYSCSRNACFKPLSFGSDKSSPFGQFAQEKAPSKLTRQSSLIALFAPAEGGSVKYSIVRCPLTAIPGSATFLSTGYHGWDLLNLTTEPDGEIYVYFTIRNQMISYSLPAFGQALGVPTEGQCSFTHEWSLDALARSSPSYGKYATIPPSTEEIRSIVQNDRNQPEYRVHLGAIVPVSEKPNPD